jgi:hypothetical protein
MSEKIRKGNCCYDAICPDCGEYEGWVRQTEAGGNHGWDCQVCRGFPFHKRATTNMF